MSKVYAVALRHDNGVTIQRVAGHGMTAETAKRVVLEQEKAPERSFLDVYRVFNVTDELKNLPGLENWFSKDTMRFFGTRLSRDLYAGRYFVTSEENPSGERRYSVRKVVENENGSFSIETVGDFHSYRSRSGAHYAARKAAYQF